MSAHTPGPWELDSAKDDERNVYFIIHGKIPAGINPDFAYPICDTMNRHHCVTPEEDAANARVMAAALKMLEALKYVVEVRKIECSTHAEGFDDICANCKIRAAIAAAEGGAK
jgi:hypothetical protein